jgi:D-3-phosphoglycerate dehydrogenase
VAKPKVLYTLPTDASGLRILGDKVEVILAADSKPETIRAAVGDADVLVVRTQLPADLLERPHHLLGIVRHGTGLDMIPVASATAQYVPVANVPGVNAETVAEYVVASFLNLARQLNLMDRDLRAVGWNESRVRADTGIELYGKTVGIIGLGNIGGRVAEICHLAFRMRVLGHQRRLDALPGFVTGADVDTICRESDFIAVCCPLTPETSGLIDARRIALMKPRAFIANPARGPIIDEMALAAALAERRIGGAAIDVYAEQPLRRDHPFLGLDNILLTPHAAGLTQESARRMSVGAATQVLQLIAGERPDFLVNPEIWEKHLERCRAIKGVRP